MTKPLALLVTSNTFKQSKLAQKLAEDCTPILAHDKEQVRQEMLVRSIPFSAFIIDASEFGYDAIEIIEVIVSEYENKMQPVIIFVVDDISDKIVNAALEAGADDVLVKPYSVYAHRRVLNYIRLHEIAQGLQDAKDEAMRAQERLEHLLTCLPGGVFRYKAIFKPGKDVLDYISPGLVSMMCCDDEEDFRAYTGNTFTGFVYSEDRARVINHFMEDLSRPGAGRLNYRILRKDGEIRWLEDWGNLIVDSRGDRWVYVVVLDITEKILESESFKNSSEHDDLTGIFNRKAAFDRIHDLRTKNDAPCSFMIMDIDNFKGINDAHGHPFGDEVLKHLADYLDSTVRSSDIVARIGGDEFAVFLMGLGNGERLTELVEQICNDAFSEFDSSEHGVDGVNPSISIGVTTAANSTIAFDDLYTLSDNALYEAKNKGKNGFSINHA